jgi:hypothetical protein
LHFTPLSIDQYSQVAPAEHGTPLPQSLPVNDPALPPMPALPAWPA